MKKEYMKPSMTVYEIVISKIICASGENPDGYIPSQPADEKHLA